MTYVLSDVHGNKDNFDSIMEKISLQPEDSLYILGDMVDRYPYGLQLIRQVMEMPNAYMLLGNHEWMMMNALDIAYTGFLDAEAVTIAANASKNERFRLWYRNHGKDTHDSWDSLPTAEQEKISDYLTGLPVNYEVNVNGRRFKLVHAAPIELYPIYGYEWVNNIEYALWDSTIHEWPILDYTVIFGHTPTCHFSSDSPMEIAMFQDPHEDCPRWIGIDCGSAIARMTVINNVWKKKRRLQTV